MTQYTRRVTVCSGLSPEDVGLAPAKNAYITLTNTAGNTGYSLKYKRENFDTAQTVVSDNGRVVVRPDDELPYRYYGSIGFYEVADASETRSPAGIYAMEFDCRLANPDGWYSYLTKQNVINLALDTGGNASGMPFLALLTGPSAIFNQMLFELEVRPFQGRPWLMLREVNMNGTTASYRRAPMPEALMRGGIVHFRLISTPIIDAEGTSLIFPHRYNAFTVLYADGYPVGASAISTTNASSGWSRCTGFILYQSVGINNFTIANSSVYAFPYLELSNINMQRQMSAEGAPPTVDILTDMHATYADLTIQTGVNYGA